MDSIGKATLARLYGGAPLASLVRLELVFSTLRLMPTTLDSGDAWGD